MEKVKNINLCVELPNGTIRYDLVEVKNGDIEKAIADYKKVLPPETKTYDYYPVEIEADITPEKMNKINVESFINFIADHKQAKEDFINYFNLKVENGEIIADYDKLNMFVILDWLDSHKQLKEDYIIYVNNKE